jgi:hypothetical protein
MDFDAGQVGDPRTAHCQLFANENVEFLSAHLLDELCVVQEV